MKQQRTHEWKPLRTAAQFKRSGGSRVNPVETREVPRRSSTRLVTDVRMREAG